MQRNNFNRRNVMWNLLPFQASSCLSDYAQQSVHLTGGILRHFRAFFYARTESCSWSFIHTRPPASNANRWAFVFHVGKEIIHVRHPKPHKNAPK